VTTASDVQVVDKFAQRQAGLGAVRREDLDRTAAPKSPAPRRRVRVQVQQPAMTELPAPQEGKYFVRLTKGHTYILTAGDGASDTIFEQGVVHEVTEQTWQHLASAIDVSTYHDVEFGRVNKLRHKFAASPSYEPIPDSYPDMDC
jgi:hypothetical protein